MNKIEIKDSVNVHIINSKKFETVSIGILLRRPLNKNEVTMNALIPNILKRGCKKYNTLKKINEKIEMMYGAVFNADIIKKGEEQLLEFYIDVINKKNIVYEALEFLFEVILNPLCENEMFDNNYVESEKENLKNEIKGRIDDKREYAKLKCFSLMCKDEPFGIYGDGYIEDLEKINNKNIYEHYLNILKTSPVEIIIIGNISDEEIISKIKTSFNIKRKKIIKIPETNYIFEKSDIKEEFEKLNVSQGKLCIGLRTNVNPVGDDFYKLMVANEIFGGNANSKLFLNVREKESLCYYINSVIYRFKTIILIQCGVESKDYNKTLKLIKDEIENMKKCNFSDEEFDNAIMSLNKKYCSIEDYQSSAMDFYLTQYMLNDKLTIKDVAEKIKSVKKEDICEIFKNVFIDTIYFLKGEE